MSIAAGRGLHLVGLTPDEITAECRRLRPEVDSILARSRAAVGPSKREIWPHQAAALYVLAAGQARANALCLEIGTAFGYSASILAQAFAAGFVVTLNPKATEAPAARGYLAPFGNVVVIAERSATYLAEYRGPKLAMVFVDGSHLLDDVRTDCQWYERLAPGGLIVFHDYSPVESRRPSPEAMQAADELGARLGRGPDVLVVDDGLVGMAGWYREAN